MTGGFRDLTRTPARPQADRRLPGRVAGPLVALGAVSAAIALAVVVAVLVQSRGTAPVPAPDTESSAVISALDAPTGSCLNTGGFDEPNVVATTSCTAPHDAQIFARLKLPEAAATGSDDAIRVAADEACQAALPLGTAADRQLSFFYPTAEEARNGERRVTCVFDDSGDPSGSP